MSANPNEPLPEIWNPRCSRCRFFDTSITDVDGERSPCRVMAPRIPLGSMSGAGMWPMVDESDWCGAFVFDQDKADDEDEQNDVR